ncbi:glycosyl hydrolase family 18 protein [Salinibacterium sp. NK8237]|uniref:glycosyl hydrolase family 18 protein n=1 Tax=Salinibacterium sp. NK8237 TaxID=2792038 RepID=UPI0018CFD764|nr:glycosyl hydrolase family 18 protein [Salinibacterium sp. NK8237]MBH0130349.1 chitinase [Salinibacterium sp. NK8237]
MTHQRSSRRFAGIALAAASAVFASALIAPAATAAPQTGAFAAAAAAADETPTALNGYRNVGYFPQWGVYSSDFKLKQLQDSGAAAGLTHINYAFGNIHNESLECFIGQQAQGSGSTGSDGAGDAWADFGMGYTAANSVSGVADTWDQPLAGSFNQLKQLKEENPNIQPIISIGGWTWSKNFSAAAATADSRENLVSSCIDLYIKGNLPVIDGRGGDGAAAGVFDGIDIDWEWPGSNNGLEGNTVDTVNDRNNFRLLLKEFRTQLDAYGETTGKHYTLSAFLPANASDIESGGWNDPELFDYLDFGNVQGYDFTGAWTSGQTGHQGNLYPDPKNPSGTGGYSVSSAVEQYTDAGIAPSQLGIGLAMYGRGWQGASSSEPWGPASGAASGVSEAGNNNYDVIKDLGTGYFDPVAGASWRYDGNQWWSYDDAKSVAAKTDYIIETGLGGAMWWDLSGNKDGSLAKTLTDGLNAATTGPVTQPGPVTPTDPTDPTEPTDPTDPTEPTNPTDPTDPSAAAWSSVAIYVKGDTVSYGGSVWTASWWTLGDVPGADQWGPWRQ